MPQSQRKLHQIEWQAGQTDGEIGQASVRRLLNIEMDKPGELRPRDAVVTTPIYSNVSAIDFAKMSADPTGDSPDGWDFYLTDEAVDIYKAGSSTLYVTLDISAEIGGLLEATSTIQVYGTSAYVVAIGGGGKQLGIMTIYSTGDNSRFAPPLSLPAYGIDGAESEQQGTPQWQMSYENFASPLVEPVYVDNSEGEQNAWLEEAAQKAVGENTVVLLWTRVYAAEEVDNVVGYSEAGAAEYAIQFKYVNGEFSDLGDETIRIWVEAGDFVAYTVAVGANFRHDVSHLNVYRRLLSAEDLEWELIDAIPVYSEYVTNNNAEFASRKDLLGGESASENWGGTWRLEDNYTSETQLIGRVEFESDLSSCNRTRGWLHMQSPQGNEGYFFHAEHFIADGTLTVTFESADHPDYEYLYYRVNAVVVAPIANGEKIAEVVGGTWLPIPWIGLGGGNYIRIDKDDDLPWDTIYNVPLPLGRCGVIYRGTSYYGEAMFNGASGTTIDWQGQTPSSSTFNSVLCMAVDKGSAALQTLASVIGGDEDTLVDVSPRHIDFVGGRMVMLDVLMDNEETHRSRLMWSEPGLFSSVNSTNYIEYGYQGGGEGVGVAKHGSKMLVMTTSSLNALDISGGSDMSWRPVGKWDNVGCIGPRAFTETPFGVVLADASAAYLWNGQGLEKLTESAQRGVYIKDTYLGYLDGLDSVIYRAKMQQVWFCNGADVLVLDLLTRAWHEHHISEGLGGHALIGADNSDGNDRLVACSTGGPGMSVYGFSSAQAPFDWGIDVGPITLNVPEVIKKLKRIYVETEVIGADPGAPNPYGNFEVDVDGNITVVERPGSGVHRVSKSFRGYAIWPTVFVREEEPWRGAIKSIAMSYKPKKLK
jgi:hypothetical protein